MPFRFRLDRLARLNIFWKGQKQKVWEKPRQEVLFWTFFVRFFLFDEEAGAIMDLMAFCIFLLTVVVCSILVYVISVYGTKEVTFEENLKASQILGTTNKKKAETKKKSKKVQKSETESVSSIFWKKYFICTPFL